MKCLDNFYNTNCVIIRGIDESRSKPSKKIEKFFNDNNIPYVVRFIEEYSFGEFIDLMKLVRINFYEINERCLTLQELLFPKSIEINKTIEDNCQDSLMGKLYEQRCYMKLPMVFRGDIGVIGYTRIEEYQQFLVDEGRENINYLWLGKHMPLTTEDKINWLVKNYAMPKRVSCSELSRRETKLYFPKTNVLFGGTIEWDYPIDVIDENGFVINYKDKFDVKMTITLDDITREFNYTSKMYKPS